MIRNTSPKKRAITIIGVIIFLFIFEVQHIMVNSLHCLEIQKKNTFCMARFDRTIQRRFHSQLIAFRTECFYLNNFFDYIISRLEAKKR